MRCMRCVAIGAASSVAFGVLSFVVAPGTWLAEGFIGPGILLAATIAAVAERVLPRSAIDTLIDFAGGGRAAFVGLAIMVTMVFWAILMALMCWWISSARESDA
jgi:hypothetical protein